MADAALFIDRIQNSAAYKVIIGGPGFTVSGFLQSDFAFNASAEYSDASSSERSTLNSLVETGTTVFNSLAGGAIGNMSQKVVKSLIETRLQYSNSPKPTFTLNLSFIARNAGENVLTKIAPLVAATAPNEVGGGAMIEAPGAFSFEGKDPVNAVRISIGQWFKMDKLVIIDASPIFSRGVIKSMTPLRADIAVTFKAARMFTADEIKALFKA